MTDKEKQRELIVEIMKADEQSGIYPAMKQTAVDWLSEKYMYVTWLRNRDEISAGKADEFRKQFLEEAKEMEKKQIQVAYIEGKWDDYGTDSNEYYKKTYGEL